MRLHNGDTGRRHRLADRLFRPRVRNWVLAALTVACTVAAVLIGLPPQSSLPTTLGDIIALPVLPDEEETRPYSVTVGWQASNFRHPDTVLFTDTYWSEAGPFASAAGLPVFLVVDDSVLADILLACSDGGEVSPRITEVKDLPTTQKNLLSAYSGGLSGNLRYLRLDDVASSDPGDYPFATCRVPSGRLFTMDDVEAHLLMSSITTVTPVPGVNRSKDRVTPYIRIVLPPGWALEDARAIQGTRRDAVSGVFWLGAEPVDPRTGDVLAAGSSYRALQVGPVNLEATSLNAARQAERKMFWSGLLVGLAGSCLLMLFEAIPWRREEGEEAT